MFEVAVNETSRCLGCYSVCLDIESRGFSGAFWAGCWAVVAVAAVVAIVVRVCFWQLLSLTKLFRIVTWD